MSGEFCSHDIADKKRAVEMDECCPFCMALNIGYLRARLAEMKEKCAKVAEAYKCVHRDPDNCMCPQAKFKIIAGILALEVK